MAKVGCGFTEQKINKVNLFQLSSIVTIYALLCGCSKLDSYFNDYLRKGAPFRAYLKIYVFIILHFAIEAINIGVIIELYFISISNDNCDTFKLYRLLS